MWSVSYTHLDVYKRQEENGMDLKEELGRVMRQYVDKNIVAGVNLLVEKKYGKVKALQWTLTHSFYAKALAVKRAVSYTHLNPHGLLIVNWRTLLNKDIEQKTKINY